MEKFDIYDGRYYFSESRVLSKDERDEKVLYKVRPFLVIDADSLIFAKIAKITGTQHEGYYEIVDWEEAGLDKPSYIDIEHPDFCEDAENIMYRGHLSENDIQRIKSSGVLNDSLNEQRHNRDEIKPFLLKEPQIIPTNREVFPPIHGDWVGYKGTNESCDESPDSDFEESIGDTINMAVKGVSKLVNGNSTPQQNSNSAQQQKQAFEPAIVSNVKQLQQAISGAKNTNSRVTSADNSKNKGTVKNV